MVLIASVNLIVGAVALVAGATALVDAGSAIAKRIGISPMWIGLTVVAIGTSMPELTVSVLASWRGSGGIAVGSVVGSNILNILIVLGVMALLMPVTVRQVTVRRDIGLVVGISVAVWAMAMDGVLHWAEGLILLAGVGPYIWYVYRAEKQGFVPVQEPPRLMDAWPVWAQSAMLAAGVALLVFGGDRTVTGGIGVSEALGVPDRVVGLTVVAIGTSAPELVTALVAVRRNKAQLALGNLIGSNLLNLLLVLGAAATVRSIPVEPLIRFLDLPFMVAVSLLLLRFGITRGRISRVEGAALLGLYVAYAGLLLSGVVGP